MLEKVPLFMYDWFNGCFKIFYPWLVFWANARGLPGPGNNSNKNVNYPIFNTKFEINEKTIEKLTYGMGSTLKWAWLADDEGTIKLAQGHVNDLIQWYRWGHW